MHERSARRVRATLEPRSRARRVAGAVGRRRCCSPAAPRTPRRTRGSRPATNAQKIQNLQWPVFLIAGIVGVIVFAAVGCVRDPLPRPRPGRSPSRRTASRRSRSAHDPPGADPASASASPPSARCSSSPRPTTPQCVVNVTGQQWWWEYRLPGAGRLRRHHRRRSSPAASWSSRPTPTCCCAAPAATSSTPSGSRAQRQARRGARPRPDAAACEADEPGDLRRPVHRVLRPLPRQHAHGGRRPDRRRLRDVGRPTSSQPYDAARRRARSPPRARQTFIAQCSRCHQVERPRSTPTATRSIAQPRTSTCTPARRRTSPT